MREEASAQAPARAVSVARNAVRLAGVLSLPKGRAPFPCVVFVHGLGSSKESPRNVVIAQHLLDAGIATLLFDLSGHGESSLDPRDGEDAYVADLEAAFRWASREPGLDPDLLGVAGSSLGAVVALRAARRRLIRPAAMVLRAPPAEPRDFAGLSVPSLVLIGSHDPLLSVVRAAAGMSEAATLNVVEAAGHLFAEPGTLQEAMERTVSWFESHLRPGAEPPERQETGAGDPASRVRGGPGGGAAMNEYLRAGDRLFRDRIEAGRILAECLREYEGKHALVLGIPRGGVPVAAEVANALDAELDIIVARKLGSPISEELAIGAVTANGGRFLNEDVIRDLQVSEAYLEQVTAAEMAEARRREERFRGGRPPAAMKDRVVIIVDDGLATGATMRAAVRSVRKSEPLEVVVAVPVGSQQACAALRQEAGEVVCPYQPEPFWAIGLFYAEFAPTPDEEVQRLVQEAHERRLARPPAG